MIEAEQGQIALEGSELKQHMFNKYKQICQPDDNVGTLTIQQFLGPELTQTLRKCPPEHHGYLTSPIMEVEIKRVVKDLKRNSAPSQKIGSIYDKIMRDYSNNLLFGDDPTYLPWFFHRFVIFILKPGKPTTCEDSYRGLSMLEAFF